MFRRLRRTTRDISVDVSAPACSAFNIVWTLFMSQLNCRSVGLHERMTSPQAYCERNICRQPAPQFDRAIVEDQEVARRLSPR